MGFIEFKKFCASNNIIKEVKEQFTVLEKIFANDRFDKRPVYKIYKALLTLDNEKTKNST